MLQTLNDERNYSTIICNLRAIYFEIYLVTGTLLAGLQRTDTLDGTRYFTLIVVPLKLEGLKQNCEPS